MLFALPLLVFLLTPDEDVESMVVKHLFQLLIDEIRSNYLNVFHMLVYCCSYLISLHSVLRQLNHD